MSHDAVATVPNGPDALAVLRAQKALALAAGCSHAAIRVGVALLEHYNTETGQCDPGSARLAALLGMSRATVFRALDELDDSGGGGLFKRTSYGGRKHQNSYTPNWPKLDALVADWRDRFKGAVDAPRPVDGLNPATVPADNSLNSATLPAAQLSQPCDGVRSQDCDGEGGNSLNSETATVATLRHKPTVGTDSRAAAADSLNSATLDDGHLLEALLRAIGRDRATMPSGMADLTPVREMLAEGRSLVDLLAHLGEVPPRRRMKAATWSYFVAGWREAPRRVAAGQALELAARATEIAARLGLAGEHLRRRLGNQVFVSWFEQVAIEEVNGVGVTLGVPTRFLRDAITARFHDEALAAWRVERPAIERINIVIGHRPSSSASTATGATA